MSGPPDGPSDRRAVCAGCGCVCDDLVLVEGPPYRRGRPHVDTDCDRGRRWFASRVFGPALDDRRPTVAGEPTPLSRAAARAAELLAEALHPRVAGLERLPLAAQRKLVEIADRTGAEIDTASSPDHLDSVLAVQRDGGAFLTLGEIRQRTDRLVLWYVDPGRTHPRLLERFYPRGDAAPSDIGDRVLVAVGPRASETGADVALDVGRSDALPLLWLVRLLADDPSSPERERHALGDAAAALLEQLRGASHGAWLYAPGAAAPGDGSLPPDDGPGAGGGPVETSGVLRLLEELNEDAPWGACPLRGEGNPAGAEAVLTWQSGYPAAVSYRTGRPRYAGPACAAGRPRSGEDVDVLLTAGGPPSSPSADDGTEVIWLDTGAARDGSTGEGGGPGTGEGAAVRIPVLPPGVREGDTLIRTDGLSVRSPGLPARGDEEWGAPPAQEALDTILRDLVGPRREDAAP